MQEVNLNSEINDNYYFLFTAISLMLFNLSAFERMKHFSYLKIYFQNMTNVIKLKKHKPYFCIGNNSKQ